jgi:formylglycine-generating enzyme required for sulfatase activity
MAIKVACPNPDCKAEYQVPQAQLGKSASCLKCGLKFTLQMSADETAAPDGKAPASASASGPSPPAPRRAQRSGRGEGGAAGELPAKIGAYQIKRLLGAGAMGHVYLAHDPHLDRDVAIKVLPRELTADEERVSRFLREARLTAKVQHANTVVIYQVMVEAGLASIVMELVEGGSLDDIVEKGGPLPWREATRAIRDAAAGLGAAHEMGLVHRDIKPANLMRTGKGTVKVVDFGLVRAMRSTSQLTQPGMILGTPSYMAPEQWMGQEADARSDLYSLVCAYYYLLAGKEPFAADSIPALGYQHRFEPFPDARQLVPELPVAVCRVLARGTQKEPAQRFQTAAELMAALDELLTVKVAGPPPAGKLQPAREMPAKSAFELDNGVKLEMVLIPAGKFLMGAPESEKNFRPDEVPQHRVQITKPFYLGVTPVTQEQWLAVMDSNPSRFMGSKNPVEYVSWHDCQQFLERLNARFVACGFRYRLPTEAEWEYACRAGSATQYCYGEDESRLGEYAWYNANSGNTTHRVGGRKPNAWGLYDMHGNVWEWCADWYDDGYYRKSPTDDPTGPATGSFRVFRGGCWFYGAGLCRSAYRFWYAPGSRDAALGLRVSRVPAE